MLGGFTPGDPLPPEPTADHITSGYGGFIFNVGDHEIDIAVGQWGGHSDHPYQILHYKVGY